MPEDRDPPDPLHVLVACIAGALLFGACIAVALEILRRRYL